VNDAYRYAELVACCLRKARPTYASAWVRKYWSVVDNARADRQRSGNDGKDVGQGLIGSWSGLEAARYERAKGTITRALVGRRVPLRIWER